MMDLKDRAYQKFLTMTVMNLNIVMKLDELKDLEEDCKWAELEAELDHLMVAHKKLTTDYDAIDAKEKEILFTK